jgi:hypothetical protein
VQRYNIFQALFMSFYSKQLYRDVANNWGGKTFLYLLMLLSLSWVYFVYEAQLAINTSYHEFSNKFAGQFPVLTIKNGTIITPEKRPYYITDPDSHKNIAIIDTTGKYKTLEDAQVPILITQNEMSIEKKENETRIYKVPNNVNAVIDPKVVDGYLIEYLKLSWVLLFPILVLGSFIYRMLQALIYGLIGKLFSAMISAKVTYSQVMQVTLVAITPAVIVSTILGAFSVAIHYELVYFLVLSLCYIFYAVYANKKM